MTQRLTVWLRAGFTDPLDDVVATGRTAQSGYAAGTPTLAYAPGTASGPLNNVYIHANLFFDVRVLISPTTSASVSDRYPIHRFYRPWDMRAGAGGAFTYARPINPGELSWGGDVDDGGPRAEGYIDAPGPKLLRRDSGVHSYQEFVVFPRVRASRRSEFELTAIYYVVYIAVTALNYAVHVSTPIDIADAEIDKIVTDSPNSIIPASQPWKTKADIDARTNPWLPGSGVDVPWSQWNQRLRR